MTSRLRSILLTVVFAGAAGCQSREEQTVSRQGDSADGGTVVRITLAEWSLDMAPDTVPAGPVTFLVTNRGTDRHDLEVEREDEEFEFGEVAVDAQQRFHAELQKGDYDVYCPLADPVGSHKSRGMIARLTVR
jgi:hypothetical protein